MDLSALHQKNSLRRTESGEQVDEGRILSEKYFGRIVSETKNRNNSIREKRIGISSIREIFPEEQYEKHISEEQGCEEQYRQNKQSQQSSIKST